MLFPHISILLYSAAVACWPGSPCMVCVNARVFLVHGVVTGNPLNSCNDASSCNPWGCGGGCVFAPTNPGRKVKRNHPLNPNQNITSFSLSTLVAMQACCLNFGLGTLHIPSRPCVWRWMMSRNFVGRGDCQHFANKSQFNEGLEPACGTRLDGKLI